MKYQILKLISAKKLLNSVQTDLFFFLPKWMDLQYFGIQPFICFDGKHLKSLFQKKKSIIFTTSVVSRIERICLLNGKICSVSICFTHTNTQVLLENRVCERARHTDVLKLTHPLILFFHPANCLYLCVFLILMIQSAFPGSYFTAYQNNVIFDYQSK